jgi:hypothetical protein
MHETAHLLHGAIRRWDSRAETIAATSVRRWGTRSHVYRQKIGVQGPSRRTGADSPAVGSWAGGLGTALWTCQRWLHAMTPPSSAAAALRASRAAVFKRAARTGDVSTTSAHRSRSTASTASSCSLADSVVSHMELSKAPARRGHGAVRLTGPAGEAPNAELGVAGGTGHSGFTDECSHPSQALRLSQRCSRSAD